jgi:hypothetical protein
MVEVALQQPWIAELAEIEYDPKRTILKRGNLQ